MSAALPRGSGIPAWIRYGVISGAFAFAVTLAASLVILLAKPADLCRVGPVMLPLSGLIAFVAFLFFSAAAGFATGRATGVLAQAALAGLVVGVVSGCAVLASVSISFSGSMGMVIRMVGLAVTVGVGMGFAAGAAALGGIVGAAKRRVSPLRPDF